MSRIFMQNFNNIVLLTLSMLLSPHVMGQDSTDSKSGFFYKMFVPDSNQLFRYKVVPIITYSPETRLGLGGGFVFNWDYKDASPNTKSSLAQSFFYYTQNNQIDWVTLFDIFTNENRFFISGKIGYLRFPQFYYGVGNEVLESNREKFTFQQWNIDVQARVKVFKGFYIGLDYYYNLNFEVRWQEDSKYENDPELIGTHGYTLSGLGPEIVYDNRNYPNNPDKGTFLSVSSLFFNKAIGSQFEYNLYKIDFRQYIPISLKRHWVLAFNFYGQFAMGEVPFNRIPALGGAQIMRGYYNGRFRDDNYIAFQLEWRMPIWRFIGLRTWLGYGQVEKHFNQYSWSGFKPNFGVGLRFEFDPKSRTNIRLDQGFGRDTDGFYLRINEAF